MAGGEVVGAVEDYVDAGGELVELPGIELLLQRGDGDFGIERAERGAGLVDLWQADALRVVEDLPLQVGEVDLIRVGEGELADAAGREVERGGATQPAGADDQRGGRAQPLLPLDPDFGKEDVAAVAEELLVVQLAGVAAGFVAATDGGCFTGSPLR
jgi:hypothetical protein